MIERSKLQHKGLVVTGSQSRRDEVCRLQEKIVEKFRSFGPNSRQHALLSVRAKGTEHTLLYNTIDLGNIDDFSAACIYEWHPEIGILYLFLEKLHADLCMEEVLSHDDREKQA